MIMMNNNTVSSSNNGTTTPSKLKTSFLLNGYNLQTPITTNNLFNTTNNNLYYNQQQQQQQSKPIYPIEKIHKLEIEKLNLQYQVRVLKKQLNSDFNMSTSTSSSQQYHFNNEINNNSNNNYAKAFLMTPLKETNNTNTNDNNNQVNEQLQLQLQQQQVTMNGSSPVNEIQQLKNQLKIYEEERDFYCKKIKELQDENLLLHAKLNQQQQQNGNGNSYSNHNIDEKDEIEKLLRLNEEKDKKIDDLTKQVLRFKRIQEIVLSAQNGAKNKNLELDFDNSDSNSIPSINSDKDIKESQLQMQRSLNGLILKRNDSSTPPSISQQDQLQQQQQQQHQQISTSSSVSSTNTSGGSQQNKQQQQQQQQNQNENNSLKQHYNTLPSSNAVNSLTLTNYLRSLNQQSMNDSTQLLTNSTTTMLNDTRSNKLSLDINSGYISDGPHHKYSLNSKTRKLASSEGLEKHKHRSLRNFFGKLMRTNSGNMRDNSPLSKSTVQTDTESDGLAVFKRGGYLRSTTGTKLKNETINSNCSISNFATLLNTEFAKYNTDKVCQWLESNGFENCVPECKSHIKNGLQLLQMSLSDYEKTLGLKNPLQRKRLGIHLQLICNTNENSIDSSYMKNLSAIDTNWITKWLDDIGLPQYKDYFQEARMDGVVLYNLTNEDLINLNVHSELHHISIKRAIQVLKLNQFNPNCLKRRPTIDEKSDKAEVINWTNHRCMEWLRSIDLSEYAPNLRGSGVHGGLMVFEPRFNSTVLADILSIPGSKTLLRRHLNTHFIDLIGAENQLLKREAELQPSFQPLSAANKIKLVKRGGGIFSNHKSRTKSNDTGDFLCPIEVNQNNYSAKTIQERNQFKSKLSILAQENVPTSIV